MTALFKKAAPAIPLFGDAYLADTRHLTLAEHGAYLQLLMLAWRREGCSLPDDDGCIARMLGISALQWRKLKPAVMAFWVLANGSWTQARLTKERQFVEEKSRKNSLSANARWHPQPLEDEGDGACERICEGSPPSPSPPPPRGKKKGKATPSGAAALIPEAIGVWSEAATRHPQWKPHDPSVTDDRRKRLTARLNEHGLDGWRRAIAIAERSRLLGGPDPPKWFGFDFLLSPTKFQRLTEGFYDERFDDSRERPSGWGAAYRSNVDWNGTA